VFEKLLLVGRKLIFILLVVLAALFILGPIIWLVLSSILSESELVSVGRDLEAPTTATLESYLNALSFSEITRGIRDTFLYSIATSFLTLSLATLAAYAFVYVALPGKRVFFLYLLAASAIPGWAIAVPIFIYIRKIGLFDTYPALIYVMTGYLLPFCTWMLISFFVNIPKELPEAALIDGCNKLQAIVRVILPLAAPGLSAIFIFSFLTTWSEFGWPLILTATRVKSLMVVIAAGMTQAGIEFGMICAQGVISLAPPVALAVVFQKYLVKGLTQGAVKG